VPNKRRLREHLKKGELTLAETNRLADIRFATYQRGRGRGGMVNKSYE